MSELLHKLNDEIAVIKKRGAVYVLEQNALVKDTARLAKLDFGTWRCEMPPATADRKPKEVSALDEWLKWKSRRTHSDLVYAPGEDEVVDDELNIWGGWGCEPGAGDVAPFLELVAYLFRESESESKEWFLNWLAYPLQNPGTKMYSAVVLHGPMQGTGKTFLGEIIGDIYGENFSLLSQDDLAASFNEAFARKQFALADEIIAANDHKAADKLKNMITRQSILINRKWETPYTLRDTINYLFTSNHFDAVFLERSDRRFMVVRVPDTPLSDEFYRGLREWRHSGGPSHLFQWLLRRDVSAFQPHSRPPETDAHAEMIEENFDDIDTWAQTLKDTPDRILQMNGLVSERILFEPSEILKIYDPDGRKGTSQKAVSRALLRAGFPQERVYSPGLRGPVRLYALRDPAKWKSKDPSEWAAEFDKHLTCTRRAKMT